MADCGCNAAREGMEDYLHNELDARRAGDISEHLACCPPCEDEWKVGLTLTASVKRACCEVAPDELKASIARQLAAEGD